MGGWWVGGEGGWGGGGRGGMTKFSGYALSVCEFTGLPERCLWHVCLCTLRCVFVSYVYGVLK